MNIKSIFLAFFLSLIHEFHSEAMGMQRHVLMLLKQSVFAGERMMIINKVKKAPLSTMAFVHHGESNLTITIVSLF
jgi:hypothetical protein